jgi:hypothetical protein
MLQKSLVHHSIVDASGVRQKETLVDGISEHVETRV